jgi:hypothetical protein
VSNVPVLPVDEAFRKLTSWVKSLLYEVENRATEIEDILEKSDGATLPNRRQQALLVFGGVKEKIVEVKGFAKIVEQAIMKTGEK